MSRAFAPRHDRLLEPAAVLRDGPAHPQPAGAGNAPTQLNATYYAQRAGAGLIVTEGTAPSAVGQGYLNVPGLYTDEQVAGWRLVADAVHEQGGHIVAQLMHAGRIAHADNKDGAETISASAVQAPGEMVTANGPKPARRAAGAGDRGAGRRGRGLRDRRPERRRGGSRRGRDPRRQRLPAAPVPRPDDQRARGRARWLAGEPRPLRGRGRDRGRRGDRRREGGPADLSRTPVQRCR